MVEKATACGLNVRNFNSIETRSFNPNPFAAIHDSQSFWYRIATKIFVYWPTAVLKLLWKDEAVLLDRVQANGNFIRQLDGPGQLAANIGQFPINRGNTIDVSEFARKKRAKDKDYDPPNLQ